MILLSGLVSAVRVQILLCFAHRQLSAAPLLHGQGPFHDYRGSHHQGKVTAGLCCSTGAGGSRTAPTSGAAPSSLPPAHCCSFKKAPNKDLPNLLGRVSSMGSAITWSFLRRHWGSSSLLMHCQLLSETIEGFVKNQLLSKL